MRKRFSLCKKVGVFLLTAVMCTSQLNVQAEKKYDFETEYQVVAGANGYFIAKNQKGEYGLLDREGEKAVGFDYSEMEFPKDTMQYQYIKVKQNKNWGIVDYDENPLVPLNFEKVSEYSNGNTIAAGYNGNTTYLYDLKGKEQKKQLTGSGSYSVISDTVFWGKEDIRNEKDNTLVKLEENSLLDKKKNSLAVKVGDTHYAVQKYTTQLTGNLETDQNIEVYEKDEKTQDILPEEEWVKDKDSTVKGSLKLIKAVSDKNIIADMQMDDGFKVIYNIEDGQSTSKYKSIGEFRDGKAFAVDMDNNIKIIDTSGKAINKNDIEVADYKENTDSLKSGTMTESELEKEKNQDIKKEQTSFLKFENEKKDCFKLYSLIKEDVIKECNRLAKKYGYEKLEFHVGDIASFKDVEHVDMVITLHACDTATDYALGKAVKWGAKVILSVPCCQHELNDQIQNKMLSPVLKYGLLKERMSALLTDGIRAELLESKGYSTQILEFIDMEHTPKNLLIRAVKTGRSRSGEALKEMTDAIHGHLTLEKLIYPEGLSQKKGV